MHIPIKHTQDFTPLLTLSSIVPTQPFMSFTTATTSITDSELCALQMSLLLFLLLLLLYYYFIKSTQDSEWRRP